MSKAEKLDAAKKYVDEQLKVMAQHSSSEPVQPTSAKYNEMVKKVAKAIICK